MIKKSIAAIAVAGVAVTAFAGAADAKGKPGDNDLAPGGNIVEVAMAANTATGLFDYLLEAAQCDYFDGAIVDLLTGDEQLTVFAPIDPAFQAVLDLYEVESPCDLPADTLGAVLSYHVSEGRRFSNSVFNAKNSKTIEMLNGTITSNPDLTLTEGAEQTVSIVAPFFDINANNGVIHVIDTVLLPG